MKLALAALVVVGACSDGHFLVVTIDGRPAVHDVATIRLGLGNAGSMRSDDFPFTGHSLPVTFSLSSPDRTGDLAITALALDASGTIVGSGTATSAFQDDSATLTMEGTDFVVNTAVADNQLLSADYNANGNQLAATFDENWLVTYREKCDQPCQMYARRFDKTGKAIESAAAASDMAFTLTTEATTSASNPAAAGKGTDTIAVWDFNDGAATPSTGIACRAIDATGATPANQTTIAVDSADAVAVAPLLNGSFGVVWTAVAAPGKIAAAIVNSKCQAGATVTVALEATGDFFQVPVLASSADGHVMYAWINNDAVLGRIGFQSGLFATTAGTLVTQTGTDRPVYARVVPLGSGFGVVTRWIPKVTGMNLPGHIDLTRFDSLGKVGAPGFTITKKSGGEFATVDSFGAAARPDGTTLVVWHACGADGDGNGCGVFGRFFRTDGPVGDEFVIPTTTVGDQTDPSVVAIGDAFVVAWTDLSAQPPDTSGSAVRARIVYVPVN